LWHEAREAKAGLERLVHNGASCHVGSWFFWDSGNYLLAGIHGLPAVEARTIERIKLELTRSPPFHKDIDTIRGLPPDRQ